MGDLEPAVDAWWIVVLLGADGTWQVHAPRPRPRASAEQYAADLNGLGSTRERGLRYAAAALTVLTEVAAA